MKSKKEDLLIMSMHEQRIESAREAIEKAGGPAALAQALSKYLQTPIKKSRVAKWRFVGVPVEFGPIIEHLIGVRRERLNPWEYTTDTQLIHSPGIAKAQGCR